MQQQAWLNAAPGKAKTTRYAQFMAAAKKAGAVPSPYLELPELPPAVGHIVEYLFDVGPISGEHAVSWPDIESWSRVTSTVINEFQASTIRVLSKAYLGMLHAASAADCPAPVEMRGEESQADRRARVDAQLRGILRGMNDPKAKAARTKKRRDTRE